MWLVSDILPINSFYILCSELFWCGVNFHIFHMEALILLKIFLQFYMNSMYWALLHGNQYGR